MVDTGKIGQNVEMNSACLNGLRQALIETLDMSRTQFSFDILTNLVRIIKNTIILSA